MYELAMMEWLVIAIIYSAAIGGCVTSKSKEAQAATTAHAVPHAVSINTTTKEA